jgi:hypothetical protein
MRFKRMSVAAKPPTKKKKVIAARYSQAILLWSVVNNQDFHP